MSGSNDDSINSLHREEEPLPVVPSNNDGTTTDDEAQLLATLDVSLQEQSVYESAVLQEATHQLAPSLVVVVVAGEADRAANNNTGFPSLHALVPGHSEKHATQQQPQHAAVAQISDLVAFSTVLQRTQKRIRAAATESLDPTKHGAARRRRASTATTTTTTTSLPPSDLDCLKEQMLWHFLSTVSVKNKQEFDLPRRRSPEEQAALDACRQQKGASSASSSSPQEEEEAPLHAEHHDAKEDRNHRTVERVVVGRRILGGRPRTSMMKRKRLAQAQAQEDEDDDETMQEHKAHLKRMRVERQERRAKRRGRVVVDHDSEQEAEFDAKPAARVTSTTPVDAAVVAVKQEDGTEETHVESSGMQEEEQTIDLTKDKQEEEVTVAVDPATQEVPSTFACPLCQAPVEIADPAQVDETLALHMQTCQTQGGRLGGRSTRRRAAAPTTSMLEDPELLVNTTTTRRTRGARLTTIPKKTGAKRQKQEPIVWTTNAKDDLEEWVYDERVDRWIDTGVSEMKVMKERDAQDVPGAMEYDGGLFVPAWIYDRLFGYQREGIEWLWGLHRQQAGGIVGDEMGLGKTVQVSAFLGAMASSRKLRSVLVVAPATMLQHWLKELAVWAPGLRRVLIHPSGEVDGHSRSISAQRIRSLDKWLREARRDRVNEAIDDDDWDTMAPHSFCGTGIVIVTTYENLRRNADVYTAYEWSYMICDESQKLKNPDADITLACKRIRTPHRLAMSGTPIQNDLTELWSIFDFSNAGLLGTLPAFQQEFADPIRRGGYSNASPVQVQLAYRCSLILRDLIKPYLLRRQKKDVKEVSRMPGKTEHVLFCRLTDRQRSLYEAYLRSDEVSRVVRGSTQLFAAITMLRKICNHPDLCCEPGQSAFDAFVKNAGTVSTALGVGEDSSDEEVDSDGETLVERSGKLEVLSKILPLWHKQGHRVLIFCQWRKMLSIVQRFTVLKGWKFGRLDGNTSIAARQQLVDDFNTDKSYFGMLCTTRTGGVGLNLTGANRIILYDPDFNPSVDAQARERAWRFGQEREVTIYRLITAGTVEEKIYQRQIFKTALSNKILQDPRQRRLFSQKDLKDLFTLRADNGSVISGGDGMTETGRVTRGVGVLDVDEEVREEGADDNNATLKKVMQSKGLAGIFDHHYLEKDPFQKSVTTSEMEEHAKRIAREALSALRKSTLSQDRFAPTWTGSEQTDPRLFGPSNSSGKGVAASSQLLSSLRQRQADADTGGERAPVDGGSGKYANLLSRVKEFVRRWKPATDDILEEFKDVKECDVAVFRRLLKSVAAVRNGKWYLLDG